MSESEVGISLVRDDLLFRIQRRIGLIPSRGLGIVRRAIFFALLAWLPIAVWAGYTGRALSGVAGEPLLQHFGIHVRFLIAVPLLILGEGVAHGLTAKLIPYFLTSGLVREEQQEASISFRSRFIAPRAEHCTDTDHVLLPHSDRQNAAHTGAQDFS